MSQAGVHTIVFSVTNSQGLSASINRTLAVQPICPSGETLCSNQVSAFCCCIPAVPLDALIFSLLPLNLESAGIHSGKDAPRLGF